MYKRQVCVLGDWEWAEIVSLCVVSDEGGGKFEPTTTEKVVELVPFGV